jgi:hypothetical protein
LAINRLKVELRPLGKKGPDLRVSCNAEHIFIEVARLRPDKNIEQELREAGQRGELVEYPITDQQIYSRILGKYEQLVRHATNVILLHSDHVAKEEIDFQQAISDIRMEILRDPGLHTRVGAVIFCSIWVDQKGGRCYAFRNEHADCAIPAAILEKVAASLDPRFEML